MQHVTNLFMNNETNINLKLTHQVGLDNNVRLREVYPCTFESMDGFNEGLKVMHNTLCDNIERFYNAMKRDLANSLMNDSDKEETRQFNSVKFEFMAEGKLNGKEIKEKITKLDDFLTFSRKYGINPHGKILDVLKFSDESSDNILFYPEREPMPMRFCNVI